METPNSSNSMFVHAANENGFPESNGSGIKSDNVFDALEHAAGVTCGTCSSKDCNHQIGVAASDVHMASRRAEEAAIRRSQAVAWLQTIVGSLGISNEPSEEELRLCLRNGLVLCNLFNKIHPGAVPKIVECTASLNASDGALSAYQHFENVRNFLVAVEELKLPSFEASDLDKGSLLTGSMVKVVDCILALKAYCDWRENGGLGLWKYTGALKHSTKASSPGHLGSLSNGKVQLHKPWNILEMDLINSEPPVGPNSRDKKQNKGSCELDNISMKHGEYDQNTMSDTTSRSSNSASSTGLSDSTGTWIKHIHQKFQEVLTVKPRCLEILERSDTLSTSDSLNPLSNLVRAVLVDKKPEEVPLLVEFMMGKVMEEFERRLSVQATQVKKLRVALKELLSREDRLLLRLKTLEALAAGSGEEVKLVANQLQLIKIEKQRIVEKKKLQEENTERLMKDMENREVEVEALKKEVEQITKDSNEHVIQLEFQKKIEHNAQATITQLSTELEESRSKVQNLEAAMKSQLENFGIQQTELRNFLNLQLPVFKELKSVLYSTRQDAKSMKLGWQKEMVSLQSQLEGVVAAATSYHKVLAENRKLYNEVQDLKGNIRVFCRVRPFLGSQAGKHSLVEFLGENGDISICNPSKHGRDSSRFFKFNKVYGASSSQEEVFHDTRPLIRSVLDGFNVCIFAYGQTGSGKTYTMSGPSITSEDNWGVNYRALNDLFQISQSRKDVVRYEVGVQMIEIYNEQVRDLLSLDGLQKRLEIRNNSQQNGLNVPDASMLPVNSTDDVVELMNAGQRNRAVGATALNERSSRSHSVLTVHIQGTELATGSILRGSLHLVDLAGSERVDKSEAVGERLREAQHINKSLSALGDVISALAQKSSHIPYRNSKLTQLLQESLGGQAKTLMFVHISPDNDSYGETVSTLKFAERVASVELGAARTNKESGEVRELKEQVALLQDALSRKEVDIIKKDSEIEQLQNLKGVQNMKSERSLGSEKQRVKAVKSASDMHRSSVEPQASNIRKHASDIAANMEGRQAAQTSTARAQKRHTLGHLTQDPLQNGYEGVSTIRSSACATNEDATDKFGLPKVLHSRSASTDSQSSVIGPLVPLEHAKQKARDAVFDRSTSLKDWSDRIQMSNDSLLASGSLDEEFRYWDDSDMLKLDEESYTPNFGALPPDFMVAASGMELKMPVPSIKPTETSTHRLVTEPVEENFGSSMSDILNGYLLENDSLSNHHFDIESMDARVDFDDRLSEFSEGGFSQEAERDALFGTSNDLSLPRKTHTRKLQQTEKRSLLQTQIPRPPSRHDRKHLDGGQPHASSNRRQSPGVHAFPSTDNGSKRQVSSPESKYRQAH